MSLHKRFTARLLMAHLYGNVSRSVSSHLVNCGGSRANSGDIPDFWGMIVIMSHRLGADSALPFG